MRPLHLLLAACALTSGCEPPEAPRVALGAADARLSVAFASRTSQSFVTKHVRIWVDQELVANRIFDGGGNEPNDLALPPRTAAAGSHVVDVHVTLGGNGSGVFSYLKGYSFDVKSSHVANLESGRTLRVLAEVFEQGGPTTPLEKRPAVRWTETWLTP